MRPGLFFIALLVSLAAMPGRSSGMNADGEKRLVLIESPSNRLSKAGKERLRAAIGEVVAKHGLDLIPSQTLSDKLLRCELPGCLSQIAAASGATFVLRVEARFTKESFKLAVELWSSDDGKRLGREDRDCPICDEQDLWGSAALLAQGLLDCALRQPDQGPAAPPAMASVPAASPPPPGPASTRVQGQATTDGARRFAGYAGLTLAVAGAALLAAGIYYVAVDGDPACDRCDWRRDTAKDGRSIAIGGGAALAAGAGLLLWRLWPSAPVVSMGPSGIFLAGRFQ